MIRVDFYIRVNLRLCNNGAKRVTEEFIKVSLARMETGQDVQTHKLA